MRLWLKRIPLVNVLLVLATVLPGAGCHLAPAMPPPAPTAPSRPAIATPAVGSENCQPALVKRVVDGDTAIMRIGEREYRVRYIGVDAPESVTPDQPVERMGPEAARANRELVEGKWVCLERDQSDTDQYGRALRYVWLGDRLINRELVASGYVRARQYPPDLKRQEDLDAAEREARAAGLGIWAPQPTPKR